MTERERTVQVQLHRPRDSPSCKWTENRPGYLSFLTSSTSMMMETSSPTTPPPLSRVAFHFTPKSWRLILVVAVAALRVLPQGSFIGAVGPSTSSTTSLVVPRMVRSPVTLSLPGAICSTLLDLNVIEG